MLALQNNALGNLFLKLIEPPKMNSSRSFLCFIAPLKDFSKLCLTFWNGQFKPTCFLVSYVISGIFILLNYVSKWLDTPILKTSYPNRSVVIASFSNTRFNKCTTLLLAWR